MNSEAQPVPNGIPKAGINFAPQFVTLPGFWMRETGNKLHVGSRSANGSLIGNLDDFVINDVVIL